MKVLHMIHSLDCAPGEIGVTARRGDKWYNTIGENIDLCVCENGEHDVQGRGVIIDNWYGLFRDVPARFIEMEHELKSRIYSGLLESMKRAYGPEFEEDNEVTIVVYNRLE